MANPLELRRVVAQMDRVICNTPFDMRNRAAEWYNFGKSKVGDKNALAEQAEIIRRSAITFLNNMQEVDDALASEYGSQLVAMLPGVSRQDISEYFAPLKMLANRLLTADKSSYEQIANLAEEIFEHPAVHPLSLWKE